MSDELRAALARAVPGTWVTTRYGMTYRKEDTSYTFVHIWAGTDDVDVTVRHFADDNYKEGASCRTYCKRSVKQAVRLVRKFYTLAQQCRDANSDATMRAWVNKGKQR